ncbi:MAG: D-glycero-beta-D-manno-heptose 1,7-bisphosphate 7-phosphatase [Myxococcota bacterium]
MAEHRLILIDRDGVINDEAAGFVKHVSEFHAIPGSLEAIARLSRAGHRVAIVTNQSGLARSLFSLQDLEEIHRELLDRVAERGGRIDRIEICPHLPTTGCACRKPAPGMLARAAEALGFEPDQSILIGDRASDLAAAEAFGCPGLLVRTGHGGRTERAMHTIDTTRVFDDLAAAVNAVLGRS